MVMPLPFLIGGVIVGAILSGGITGGILGGIGKDKRSADGADGANDLNRMLLTQYERVGHNGVVRGFVGPVSERPWRACRAVDNGEA